MNEINNISLRADDSRSIQRIIFEKANFGAVPVYFKVDGDDRLHPVQWTRHPHLETIVFSDGSSSQVTPAEPSETLAMHVGAVPGKPDADEDSMVDDLKDIVAEGTRESDTEINEAPSMNEINAELDKLSQSRRELVNKFKPDGFA
jgi:hypothetical protein